MDLISQEKMFKHLILQTVMSGSTIAYLAVLGFLFLHHCITGELLPVELGIFSSVMSLGAIGFSKLNVTFFLLLTHTKKHYFSTLFITTCFGCALFLFVCLYLLTETHIIKEF